MTANPLARQFFHEFPGLAGKVSFVFKSDPERTENPDALALRNGLDQLNARSGEWNICYRPTGSIPVYLIKIDDHATMDMGFLGQTGLFRGPQAGNKVALTDRLLREFVFHHECGHVLADMADMAGKTSSGASKYIETINHHDECFCDSYAALRLIQKHGAPAISFIREFADMRILKLVGDQTPENAMNDAHHFTTYALDRVLAHVAGTGIAAIRQQDAHAAVGHALQIAKDSEMAPMAMVANSLHVGILESNTDNRGRDAGILKDEALVQRFNAAVNRRMGMEAGYIAATPEENRMFQGPWSNAHARFSAASILFIKGPDPARLDDVKLMIRDYAAAINDREATGDRRRLDGLEKQLGEKAPYFTAWFKAKRESYDSDVHTAAGLDISLPLFTQKMDDEKFVETQATQYVTAAARRDNFYKRNAVKPARPH